MAHVVHCPECDTALKLREVPEAGRKIRCPSCSEVFAPPTRGASTTSERPERSRARRRDAADYDDRPRRRGPSRDRDYDDEYNDRPRRKSRGRDYEDDDYDEQPRRRKTKKSGFPIGWVLGAGGALVVVTLLILLLVNLLSEDKFTEKNFAKVKVGMTTTQVENLLGDPDDKADPGRQLNNLGKWVGMPMPVGMPYSEIWTWDNGFDENGMIYFDNNGKVMGWHAKFGSKTRTSISFPQIPQVPQPGR